MNIVTTTDLNSVEGIEKAIAENKGNKAMLAVLQELLRTKKRELELLAKKTSSRTGFTEDQQIVKSVFVALRQYTHNKDSNSNKAFKAVVTALNIDFNKKLQEQCFSSSVLHCAKSNLNKSKNVYDSIQSYREAARQAKILLPLIEDITWKTWEASMYAIAKLVIEKRKEVWNDPYTDKGTTDTDKGTTDTDKGTTDTDKGTTDTDKGTTDTKKVVITTRKKKK